MLPLILASSSKYRRQTLSKLGLPFHCQSPEIDETALANESASALVQRLSLAKAQKVAAQYSQHLLIGSDQIALTGDGEILTKPENHAHAKKQLTKASGQRLTFYTGLALINSQSKAQYVDVETTIVEFRRLSAAQIERYLQLDQPYDCAGSFKSEALGIILFNRIESRDPNALTGLPLMRLVDFLAEENITLPLNP